MCTTIGAPSLLSVEVLYSYLVSDLFLVNLGYLGQLLYCTHTFSKITYKTVYVLIRIMSC